MDRRHFFSTLLFLTLNANKNIPGGRPREATDLRDPDSLPPERKMQVVHHLPPLLRMQ